MGNDLGDTIRENASGPKRASGDSGSIEQHRGIPEITSALARISHKKRLFF